MKSMQVVLSTIGRFHNIDLARQLHKRGFLKRVFTGYPRCKLRHEDLPADIITTFPWLHAPLMALNPHNEWLKKVFSWQDNRWFDRFVAANMPECDLLHGLSETTLCSGMRAKKLGAKYILDRGSSHVRFQDELLREEYESYGLRRDGADPRAIEVQEAEYELADAITVPSGFARNTFPAWGVPLHKVHCIPYGVDLSRYRPVSSPQSGTFQVLFAGRLSVRKGIRYLLESFERLRHPAKRLVLAGGVDPRVEPFLAKVRQRDDVFFAGHVPRVKLVRLMSESHVLVLPSVEDGFGLVQSQALACGCPVIASLNTGAQDLFENGVEGYHVPIRNVDAIVENLQKLADDPDLQAAMSSRALALVQRLGGWDRYGELASKIFASVLEARGAMAVGSAG